MYLALLVVFPRYTIGGIEIIGAICFSKLGISDSKAITFVDPCENPM